MAPSSIFYNGAARYTPQSVSKTDATAFNSPGASPVGVVGVIGQCVGLKPVSAISLAKDIPYFKSAEAALEQIRDGVGTVDEAIQAMFDPFDDPVFESGASGVYVLEVNTATRASAYLTNGYGDVMQLQTERYGAYTNQTLATVAAATNAGTGAVASTAKLVTLSLEDTSVATDDVGENVGTFQYVTGTDTYDTAAISVTPAGQVSVYATRTETTKSADLASSSTNHVVVVSGTSADAGKILYLYGLVSGAPTIETLTLDTDGDATGTVLWDADSLCGARLSAAAAGTIDIDQNSTTIYSISATETGQGVHDCSSMYVANRAVALSTDTSTTGPVMVIGVDHLGQVKAATATLSSTGVRYMATDGSANQVFSRIDHIATGEAAAADVTLYADAIVTSPTSTHDTLAKVRDHFNNRGTRSAGVLTEGFGCTLATGETEISPAKLDEHYNVSLLSTGATLTKGVQDLLDYFNTSNDIVDATEATRTLKVASLTIDTAATSHTWSLDMGDGVAIPIAYAGTASDAAVQTGIIAATAAMPGVGPLVTPAASSTDAVAFTAKLGLPFVLATSDGNLTAAVTTTAVGRKTVPDNQTKQLGGAVDGTATYSDYEAAFTLLRQVRVNHVWVDSADPAVHAALEAHLQYRATLGKSEADGVVGLQGLDGSLDPDGAVPTKFEAKELVAAINSRHVRCYGQNVERFDRTGVRTTMGSGIQAAVAIGMSAGSPIGESLTSKGANVLSVSQDTSWNPFDDSDELIKYGLSFMRNNQDGTVTVVRNTTSYIKDANLVYTEASVNEACNYAIYTYRRSLEVFLGQKGLPRTVNAAFGVATTVLGELVDLEVLVAYKPPRFELTRDILENAVELAPVVPINFASTVAHFVPSTFTANG